LSTQTDPDFLANEEYGRASDLNIRNRIQEQYRTNPQDWFTRIFERFTFPESCWILELGCGPGDLWLKNLSRLPQSWNIVLSDLSQGMLQDAHRLLPAAHPQFSYCVIDTQSIPSGSDKFEAVLGIGLLDHIPERVEALNEIQRVLKPGGRFYASAGGRSHLQEIESLVRPFLPDADYGGDPHRFGLENGERLLAPWFKILRSDRYSDELVFDRAEPIIAYVLSEASVKSRLVGEKLASFRQFVINELAVQGKIRVTTEKGIFEAINAG
jgi:SAM-dependent methyltransferase